MTSTPKTLYFVCKLGNLPINAKSKSRITLSLERNERGPKKADPVGAREAAFIEADAA
jgi:hypothetical protein